MGDSEGHIFRVGLGSVMSGTVTRLSMSGYRTANMDPAAMASSSLLFVPRLLVTAESQSYFGFKRGLRSDHLIPTESEKNTADLVLS